MVTPLHSGALHLGSEGGRDLAPGCLVSLVLVTWAHLVV